MLLFKVFQSGGILRKSMLYIVWQDNENRPCYGVICGLHLQKMLHRQSKLYVL